MVRPLRISGNGCNSNEDVIFKDIDRHLKVPDSVSFNIWIGLTLSSGCAPACACVRRWADTQIRQTKNDAIIKQLVA